MRNAEHLGEFEIVDLVIGKIKFWIYKEKIKNYNEIVVTNSNYDEIALYYPDYGLRLMKEGYEELIIQLIETNMDILNEYKTT